MCTAVIAVPEHPDQSVRLLAIRDEDPRREWADLGHHWADRPEVIGIADRRAGGAWLASNSGRGEVAVLLNRAEQVDLLAERVSSRGELALAAVSGEDLPAIGSHHGFNLLRLSRDGARVQVWDGEQLTVERLTPGVHLLAHTCVDDPDTARIARWLPEFAAAAGAADWRRSWLEVLDRSGRLDRFDPAALIRDNSRLGLPTSSLLVVLAELDEDATWLSSAVLDVPGEWSALRWQAPR